MKKLILFWVLLVSLIFPNAFAQHINLVGSTAKIMKEMNLSAVLSLDTISNRKHLYAIGAVKNLQGEVLIVDGKALVAELDQNRLPRWVSTWDRELIFLVSANVNSWNKIMLDIPIRNRAELEAVVFKEAEKLGLDTSGGFPFRVKVKADTIQAHIAFLRPETIAYFTPQGKKQDDFPILLTNKPVRIIGFAGTTAGGRFAMPAMPSRAASNMHMHYLTADESEAGHIEELNFQGKWQLCLPMKQ